ncbi:zinc-dependent metalloprotease [Stratiformator vulcanicus]|uniref:DUF5117 domain-containing protein n=1 Tax=Stratiformator vulcanicus TaxID=2527980 RepID=A0A517R3J1_9PLAN|nr:zinc-dependent metalloprotease [Stratiformator vulcanicus]QDT38458.1 hypothetical protein Pan189_28520 [Stratiformator vulcanicus]
MRCGLLSPTTFLTILSVSIGASTASADDKLPPHAKVLEGFEKVVSTADRARSMWTVHTKADDNQVYLELPKGYESKKYFIALTVASGDLFAGLQSGDMYVYWKKYQNTLALIQPNVEVRSTGDDESKSSVQRLFTDRVLLQVPIVTNGPGGGPVIDGDALFVGQAEKFFGPGVQNRQLRGIFELKAAKAFPENIEISFEVANQRGTLQTLHYSISLIKDNPKYKPRRADTRLGYFTTTYRDLGKYSADDVNIRNINRWHLEKADGDLSLSPPKKPIVFYIEHTTPIRYRRWVREGILYWNKAFENVGLASAIEVYYQDKNSGAHMDKDPEDVRYNFVRWLNNDIGTAIGPSRVHPLTGEILDADIVLTDGWIRYYRFQFEDLLPKIAVEGFSAETLAWLADNPSWDPRVRMAHPASRDAVSRQIDQQLVDGAGAHPDSMISTKMLGDDQFDGLLGRSSQVNGFCLAASNAAFDTAVMRMHMAALAAKEAVEAGKPKEEKDEPKESMIDGMPESFVGPLLAHLVSHEVGHTLGLRHNFKGSSLYSLEEINSESFDTDKPIAASVMDYNPTNVRLDAGETQGPYTMLGIGPYDHWAIEYGYTFDSDLEKILKRVAEPELQYATDEDTYGPDPLARRYDFGQEPLKYAFDQVELAEFHRKRLLEDFVAEGESWAKARDGYTLTLGLQLRAVSMMANWVGGAHIYRDKKGDPNGRSPIDPVAADVQRDALDFVLKKSFRDEAYGLTPELMRHLTTDKWFDEMGWSAAMQDSTWPVHDQVLRLQSSTLTMLMNPTTLRRVHDNELLVASGKEVLTLSGLMDAIEDEIWSELSNDGEDMEGEFSERNPAISSLRRNLQREHLSRLIDLSTNSQSYVAAFKPISNLARLHLIELDKKIEAYRDRSSEKLDSYTAAHLGECQDAIERARTAQLIYRGG